MSTARTAAHPRVLLVEDDPTIRQALSLLLPHYGAEVATAPTVAEALEHLAAQPDTCVVLDLMLGDGSGLEVLRHVRRERLPARVAVVTGSGDPELLAEVRSLGPDALFEKPMDSQRLAAWLAEC